MVRLAEVSNMHRVMMVEQTQQDDLIAMVAGRTPVIRKEILTARIHVTQMQHRHIHVDPQVQIVV